MYEILIMLDSQLLRKRTKDIAYQLARRGYVLDTELITKLEKERKELQIRTQVMKNEKNIYSKEIGIAKKKGENVQHLINEVNKITSDLSVFEQRLLFVCDQLLKIQLTVPNIPHESTPNGVNEYDNVEVRRWGERRHFNFSIMDHVALGTAHNNLDFDLATKLVGTRFAVIKGELARLHRALIQFMLDLHTSEHGYCEVYVPNIVNYDSLKSTGQLPKFEHDLFKIHYCDSISQQYYLIPTAEVPVTNFVRQSIIEKSDLPLKYVAHTPCFRSEAGSYGKDTKGLIRQHQFEKVELVQIVCPEDSFHALEELTKHAEVVLQKLELPYRVISLCTGDLGFASTKTYDLEVWLPGQNTYREISSCSNCTDFQARRMHARWRNPATGHLELLHTINGSGLAVGRTLVAVMENYQEMNRSIRIPSVLRPYLGGLEYITC